MRDIKNDINWEEIQNYYDDNHFWSDVMCTFGICSQTLNDGLKKGKFKTRSRSESIKLKCKLSPRIHSNETKEKISISRKKYLSEHPDQVPYLLNHYSKGESYPEKYFEKY